MSAMEPITTTIHTLDHEPIEDWQTLAGAAPADDANPAATSADEVNPATTSARMTGVPTTAVAELGSIGGADFGLWEMSTGAMRDVEGDEVFLVISGTGRIVFDEPTRETIHLAPGTLVRLEDGMKTRWYVDGEPLRKLWITPSEA